MAYAFDDGEVQLWVPSDPFPLKVVEHILAGGQIRAHNAAFDRLIFWYVVCPDYAVPEPALSQWYCTATQARANALPGSLGDLGRAINMGIKKDYRGAELIRKLSIPQKDGSFNDDPVLMQEMYAYCIQDVKAMRAFSNAMRQLTDEEMADYVANETINDRGVLLDVSLAKAAVRYSAAETKDIEADVIDLSNGEVTSVRSTKMKNWVMANVGPEAIELMMHYVDGVKKYTIDKTARANLLTLDETQVPYHVAEVIRGADDLWASSVAKFQRMADTADEEDQHVRGAFVLFGASQTHRYSSMQIQLHNFPRKCAEDPQAVRDAMVAGHSIVPEFGRRTTDVLKSMLRPAIIAAPGHKLIISDWSGIEARGLPWLTDDPNAEPVLNVFREGRDIYLKAATGIYGGTEEAVTPDQRQVGKVVILACGYSGGHRAFASMAKNYKVSVPEEQAKKIVQKWRAANPWAPTFWKKLDSAIIYAIRHPKQEFAVGRVLYHFRGDHLWCMLPSGGILCYPFAKIEVIKDEPQVTYLKSAWKPAADAKVWPRAKLYGGLAAENVCQATCAALLRWALRECLAQGLDAVAHVHDEIIIESDSNRVDSDKAKLEQIMCSGPSWAKDFPLAVGTTVRERYSK